MKKIFTIFITITSSSSFLYAQNVGIGVAVPAEKLHVDGGNIKLGSTVWLGEGDRVLKFGDGDFVHIGEVGGDDQMEIKANQGITLIGSNLKISIGTPGTGKLLTSDASGNANWQTLSLPAATASFRATKTAIQTVFSGASYLMNFPVTDYNDGGAFSSDAFTAAVAGVYHFDIKLLWSLTATASRYNIIVSLNTGGGAFELSRSQYFIEAGTSGSFTSDLSLDIKLTAGQYVYVNAFQNSGTSQNVSSSFTNFSGHKLY